MARNTINFEFNQYIVTVATIVAAVAAGYLSYATGIANPLVAAATAGAIGFAVSYARDGPHPRRQLLHRFPRGQDAYQLIFMFFTSRETRGNHCQTRGVSG
jgi:hypothetical protein